MEFFEDDLSPWCDENRNIIGMVQKKKSFSRANSKLLKSEKVIKRARPIRRRTKHLSMMKTPVPETSADSKSTSPKRISPKTKSPKLISNSISIDQ